MTLWHGAVLVFCVFIGLLALFIGWFIDTAQKSVDRHLDERLEVEHMHAAMKRWPP